MGSNQLHAQYAYVTNAASYDISVVNLATNEVRATIATGSSPMDIVVDPKSNRMYVSNASTNTISVYNLTTYQILAIIPTFERPLALLLSPDGSRLYVGNSQSRNVLVFNTANNLPIAIIKVGRGGEQFVTSVIGMLFSPDRKRIYCAINDRHQVEVINLETNQVEKVIEVGANPIYMAWHPDGSRLYVSHASNSYPNVSVINTHTQLMESTIPIGSQNEGIAVSPDGKRLYVGKFPSGEILVFNTATQKMEASILTQPGASQIALNADGSLLYVTNFTAVSVINTATNTVKTKIPVGAGAVGLKLLEGTTPPSTSFEGYLDKVECGTIRGWVWDSKQPNTPLTVEFTADGNPIGTALANIYRQDLKDAGKGNGEHVYSFTTPDGLKDGKPHSISAKVQGSAYTLKWVPKALTCAPQNRLAAENPKPAADWSAVLLGNPVETGTVEVEIKGAQGQSVKLLLVDPKGLVIGQSQVKIAESSERHRLLLESKPSGVLLLQVSTPTYSRTLKVVSEK
ncbi:hypothetical protein GCM10027299_42380 [Larkinella ripae]